MQLCASYLESSAMNKQLLQKNNSSESFQLQEGGGNHTTTAIQGKSTPSFFALSKNFKSLLLVVGILAGVAVCVVVATAVGTTQAQRGAGTVTASGDSQFERRELHDDPLIDMATKEQLLRKVYSPQPDYCAMLLSNIC